MKKLVAIAAAVIVSGTVGFAQMTDEQHLEQLMQEAKQNMQNKQGEQKNSDNGSQQTVKTKKTVTIITVITQTQVIDEDVQETKKPDPVLPVTPQPNPNVNQNVNANQNVNVNVNVNPPVINPSEPSVFGPRPIDLGTFIIGETLAVCVPGFGLGHFTVGDTGGGMLCLAFTGISILSYIGAEIAVETRTIDNPAVYSAWHWGSVALFAAGYLIDIIGTPIYYAAHNAQFAAYVKPVDLTAFSFDTKNNDLNMNVINFGIEF